MRHSLSRAGLLLALTLPLASPSYAAPPDEGSTAPVSASSL